MVKEVVEVEVEMLEFEAVGEAVVVAVVEAVVAAVVEVKGEPDPVVVVLKE